MTEGSYGGKLNPYKAEYLPARSMVLSCSYCRVEAEITISPRFEMIIHSAIFRCIKCGKYSAISEDITLGG